LVDFLTSSAATVQEGFERLAKYLPIVTNETTFGWTVASDMVEVRLVNASGALSWFSEEWTLGATIRGFRGTLGATFTPLRLDLQRPNAAGAEPMLERITALGAFPIQFGQPRGGMVLPLSLWQMRQPSANSRLHDALEAHAAELLSEKLGGNSMAARVRRELVSELRGGEPTVQKIAKKLATTARTLQRRLAQESTAFQTELDQVRAQLAKRYLTEEGLSVTEVAFLLGFSEASAFARAHRRWYGRAPRERSPLARSE
jgi:AraC-like DNA-binding protein